MAVFLVYQGETYKEEREGGYVWSPQLNSSGRKNAGYTMMTNIHKGDFILHSKNSKIVSLSIAKEDCKNANKPHELSIAKTTVNWSNNGYRVDTDYFDFDHPVRNSDHRAWLAKHYIKSSAFDKNGKGKTQYMCHLADEHAIYLLKCAISLQNNTVLLNHLNDALAEIVDEKESEYDQVETESIRQIIDNRASSGEKPKWQGKREPQAMTTSAKTGRDIPKRDPQRAADALAFADYKCEFNHSDRTFLRKNGTPYTEPHHLIPISKYRDFNYSVDVMENIVSLCSHCHNLIHYGRLADKEPVLAKLFNDRKAALKTCGLDLTFDQLKSYYS